MEPFNRVRRQPFPSSLRYVATTVTGRVQVNHTWGVGVPDTGRHETEPSYVSGMCHVLTSGLHDPPTTGTLVGSLLLLVLSTTHLWGRRNGQPTLLRIQHKMRHRVSKSHSTSRSPQRVTVPRAVTNHCVGNNRRK